MAFTVPSPVFRTLAQVAGSSESLLTPAIWAYCEGEKLHLTACNTFVAFDWTIHSWRWEHDFYGIEDGWGALLPFPKDLHKVKTGEICVQVEKSEYWISADRSDTRIYKYGDIQNLDSCARKVVQGVFPRVFSSLGPLCPETVFPVNALCFNWKNLGFDKRASMPIGFDFLGQGSHGAVRSASGPLVFGFNAVHYRGWEFSARYVVMPILKPVKPSYDEAEE